MSLIQNKFFYQLEPNCEEVINYRRLALQCDENDLTCKSVGLLLKIIDGLFNKEPTSHISAQQLNQAIETSPFKSLNNATILHFFRAFKERNPSLRTANIPTAHNFKVFLKTKFRCFYDKAFPAKHQTPKVFLQSHLQEFITLLQLNASGNTTPWSPNDHLVNILPSGEIFFDLAPSELLVDEAGGMENVIKAYTLLLWAHQILEERSQKNEIHQVKHTEIAYIEALNRIISKLKALLPIIDGLP